MLSRKWWCTCSWSSAYRWCSNCSTSEWLTHWGRDEMNNISQTPFSNVFSSMKMFQFRLKFHWSLFARVQSTIFQHWFRKWLGAVQATSHYLNQWWLVYRRIYASLGLNELTIILPTKVLLILEIWWQLLSTAKFSAIWHPGFRSSLAQVTHSMQNHYEESTWTKPDLPSLTQCVPLMPCGDIDLNQHWLR